MNWYHVGEPYEHFSPNYKLKIATARAARTSYTLPGADTKHDYARDIELHDRLLASGHLSPFEHCARAMSADVYEGGLCDQKFLGGDERGNAQYEYGWCKNFRGFIQYRTLIPDESRSDSRLIKPVA